MLVKPSRQVRRFTCIMEPTIAPVQSAQPPAIIGLLQEFQEGWTLFAFEQSSLDPIQVAQYEWFRPGISRLALSLRSHVAHVISDRLHSTSCPARSNDL